jgi:hypothetical protein
MATATRTFHLPGDAVVKRKALVLGLLAIAGAGVVLVVASGARGPGSVPGPEEWSRRDPSFTADVEPVVVARCGSCHLREDPQGRLVLERGHGFSQLVGRASVQVGRPLVVPGDPDSSYLWHKLVAADGIVGKGMPTTVVGARRLPEAELELFRAWIERGAQP